MDDELLFDPEELKLELMPVGTYTAKINWTRIKTSKAGNRYLGCGIAITQAPYQAHDFVVYYHVFSQKPAFGAKEREKLSEFAKLLGIPFLKNHQMLVGKPFMIKIGQETIGSGAIIGPSVTKNTIQGYSKLRGQP
jgi:hypothetical protein